MIRKEGGFFFQLCEGGSAVVTLVMMTMRIMRGNKKDADDKEVLHWLYLTCLYVEEHYLCSCCIPSGPNELQQMDKQVL